MPMSAEIFNGLLTPRNFRRTKPQLPVLVPRELVWSRVEPSRDDATSGRKIFRPYFSCRIRLLVLTDETNNDALLALVPIKSDSNGIARILTAPRSDMFF